MVASGICGAVVESGALATILTKLPYIGPVFTIPAVQQVTQGVLTHFVEPIKQGAQIVTRTIMDEIKPILVPEIERVRQTVKVAKGIFSKVKNFLFA